MFHLPAHEIDFSFARSGGAGGQHVNKVQTKVLARWAFQRSTALTDTQKERLGTRLRARINEAGELCVVAQDERSQYANRLRAVKRLSALVHAALRVPKKRQNTRPTRASKEKRLRLKKIHSQKKTERRGQS